MHKGHYHHAFIDARCIMVPAFYVSHEKYFSVRALFQLIVSVMKEFSPFSVCVVFGDSFSKSKKEFYLKYGSLRHEKRKESEKLSLEEEISNAKSLLKGCPIRQVSHPGIEAKDIIGYLSKVLARPKIVIASSRDYFQILKPGLQIMSPKDGLIVSEHEAEAILGFPPKHYLLWKSIIGDSELNTPGIKRIGRERATRLIRHTLRTGKKFPLSSVEQKILNRNKYLFSVGAVLSKEEKYQILKIYQAERIKKSIGIFNEGRPSEFQVQEEVSEIFDYFSAIRSTVQEPERRVLQ